MSNPKFFHSTFEGAFLQKSVVSIVGTPPDASEGDLHVVASSGTTGAFVGHENEFALYLNASWLFYTPINFQVIILESAGALYVYRTGTGWGAL